MAAGLRPLPLACVDDDSAYGGKAASLGAAIRAGLPVPGGVALAAPLVDSIAAGQPDAITALVTSPELPCGRLAVRSSAIGEDSSGASFAGQHVTRLNVFQESLVSAVRIVWESARSDAALAYRAKRGIETVPAIAVVVQSLIEPVAAGVMFTRDPITGADERLVEAAWGLGETVVSGLVTPDSYRLDTSGRLLDRVVASKDVKVWFDGEEGTSEMPVDPELQETACLTTAQLDQLHALAERCRAVWEMDLDLEWAFAADGTLYLLQARPITAIGIVRA